MEEGGREAGNLKGTMWYVYTGCKTCDSMDR